MLFIKVFRAVLVAFLAFLSIHLLVITSLNAKGYEIKNWKVLEGIVRDKTLPGVFHVILEKPCGIQVETDIPELKEDEYLYFPQVDTSHIEVYANGNLIGSFGSPFRKTARIWYQPLIFQVPKGTRRIDLKIFGVSELGIDIPAVVIGERELWRYEILDFLTLKLLMIGIGMVLSVGIMMLLISRKLADFQRMSHIYIGIASLFAATCMMDMIPFWSMGSLLTMLFLRKIFLSSLYFGPAFLTLGISEFSGKKNTLDKIMFYTNALIAVAFWIIPTHHLLKIFTKDISIWMLVNVTYFFFKSVKIRNELMVSLMSFGLLTAIHDVLNLAFGMNNTKFLSAFGIVTVFLGFSYIMIMGYEDLLIRYRKSRIENITDHLTGALNRKALDVLEIPRSGTVAFIDLDKFKEINDRYGHDVGDRILKKFVEVAKKNTRTEDFVVRLGGDEFLIILKSCKPEKAREIVSRIKEEFERSDELRPSFSYGISEINGDIRSAISLADKNMYDMKNQRKGAIPSEDSHI